jgi:glycosyltransferase involved in cell wall biosynthesis
MPAFNVAPFVGAAIESVLAQTMADWELRVVDDGSTDSTATIVEGFAAMDPRVRLLRQANGGISSARNHALRAATGQFIAILDSDDTWEPTFLAEQLHVFATFPDTDVVTGNAWFLGGPRHGEPARPCPDPRPQPTLPTILADELSIFIMSVMRRRVYETIGGFDEAFRSNEDYDFWLRAALAGFSFRRNDQPLGYYRRREDSISAVEVRMLAGILRVYEKTRPRLLNRPAELDILDAQITRFKGEHLTAQARLAIHTGDMTEAADHLSALYAHSGGAAIGMASFIARRMPWLISRAYQLRRAYHGTSS